MRIYVDGKEAVLKAGSSFEYVSENPLFTEAEGYSLEIEFPLKDCPENILIFGALHVQGVDISKVTFPCVLDAGTFRKTGILTIVSVSEVEVRVQFLEGMSAGKFSGEGMNAYIDELDYSDYDGTVGDGQEVYYDKMREGWSPIVVWDSRLDEFFGQTKGLKDNYVMHVHLWKLMEIVAEICSINLDLSNLRAISFFEKVLIVNSTLDWRNCDDYYGEDTGYPDYAGRKEFMHLEKTLPHWSVRQFFEEVGKFFGCYVESENGAVSFRPFSSYMDISKTNEIMAIDEFEVEVGSEDGSSFASLIRYKLPDDCNPDNINMCPQVEEHMSEIKKSSYAAEDGKTPEYVANHGINDSNFYGVYFPKKSLVKVGTEFVSVTDVQKMEGEAYHFIKFEKLNQYGNLLDGTELGIVPCTLEFKTKAKQYFPRSGATLDCTLINSANGRWLADENATRRYYHKVPVIEVQYKESFTDGNNNYIDVDVLRESGYKAIESHYKKLFVVLYNGGGSHGSGLNTRRFEPELGTVYPSDYMSSLGADGDVIPYYKGLKEYDNTLAPSDEDVASYVALPTLDETQLYRYKFLGTTIPSPTSVFLINGQRFACLRITAHFTPSGMSELLEGEFYRIIG